MNHVNLIWRWVMLKGDQAENKPKTLKMYKDFLLQTSFGCPISVFLLWIQALQGTTICFALDPEGQKKVGLWRVWYFCLTWQHCLWHHWFWLLGTKFQHLWLWFCIFQPSISKQGEKLMCVHFFFFIPLLSIGPEMCLGFGSPLSYNIFMVFHFRCIPVEAERTCYSRRRNA